ncbi:hypothetical protein ZIOFF_017127 [Zingiber officinale]|uniref:Enoyl reductase (ER) domain-containing protein n=1 Tax=Zingiber officinale TaxID=94328 RepID=A0A8J5LI40_ZINOF|nr:hypothetical protein ZIOFF_017127 [Zingiber officinale]
MFFLKQIFVNLFLQISGRRRWLQDSTSAVRLHFCHFVLSNSVTLGCEIEMKAVVITNPGGPEVLQVQEVDDPAVGDNEVLIQVEASALNRSDTVQREGFYPLPKGASPYPGLECSGTIIALGKSVTRWKVGDQVSSQFSVSAILSTSAVRLHFCHFVLSNSVTLGCEIEMKAVVITNPGGPEVLQVQEVDDPAVGDNEVLIQVEASALNRSDTVQREGFYPLPKGASPYPGLECSGKIIALGKSVTRWKVGDQIHGGSSGIGTFAIQIAKHLGIRVFVTAGTEEKLAACKNLGADVCINYKSEDFVARVMEETGGKAAGLRNRSSENKAQIVAEVEKHVWPAIAAGKVKPIVCETFPLSEAADAHRMMESSAQIGKILLIP